MTTTRRQLILRAASFLPLLILGSESDAQTRRRKKPEPPKTTTFIGKYKDLAMRVPGSLKKINPKEADSDALSDGKDLYFLIMRSPVPAGATLRDVGNAYFAGMQNPGNALTVTRVTETRLDGHSALRVQASVKIEKVANRITAYFTTHGEVAYAFVGYHDGEAGGRTMQNALASLKWKAAPQVTQGGGGMPAPGTGPRTCPSCYGAGKVNCSYCYGRGRDLQDNNRVCSVCYDWSGKKTCSTCWGRGVISGY